MSKKYIEIYYTLYGKKYLYAMTRDVGRAIELTFEAMEKSR